MERPLPNSYWVRPGRLLAGEHPYGVDDRDARERIDRLRKSGIDSFVDLTEVEERPAYDHLLPRDTEYLRCPIVDTAVPDAVATMQALQRHIRDALARDRRIYVHCRAGIGRSGVVIGCFLAEEGLDGKAALKLLNRLWRQSARAKTWPEVPQTPQQADYIRRWPLHLQSP